MLPCLAATIVMVGGGLVSSCQAVAQQPGSEHRRSCRDTQGPADAPDREPGFPSNDSHSLPEALARGQSSALEINCKDWKSIFSIRWRPRHHEELTLCDSRLGEDSSSAPPNRPLRILFCTWLI